MKPVVEAEYRHRGEQHWWFRARRSIFSRFLDTQLQLPPDAQILDIGPGSGVNLSILQHRGDVTVLDMSRDSLEDCAQRGATHVLRGDATAPPLQRRSFDLICALDVLEHLADDASALAAWRGLLKPGGRLLLSVPALPILWGRQDVLSNHHRRYRRSGLAERVRAGGFNVQRLTYFNILLLPLILVVRLLMRPFLTGTVAKGGSDLGMSNFGLGRVLFAVLAAEGSWLVRHDLPIGVSLLCLASPEEQA